MTANQPTHPRLRSAGARVKDRVKVLCDAPVRAGEHVLYWMTANRRATWNFALQRAADLARELRRPLVAYEPLEPDHPWACDRFHAFVIDGMRDNARRFAARRVGYVADLAPRGRLAELARRACVVVTDDWPCFFVPRVAERAARTLGVRMESVDSNGLFPMRATDRVFTTAFSFRRFLAKEPEHAPPLADPLRKLPPMDLVEMPDADLARLPIDHSIGRAPLTGGTTAAEAALARFVGVRETKYPDDRNVPDLDATSGLSPWLHFGHISAHQVAAAVLSPEFRDQLLTWRELGFNLCSHRDDYDRYESLPPWARHTLEKHAGDEREHVYSLDEFAQSRTHDPLWNAAQRQLVREGRMHNYLRMLWGKKVVEWTASPREALAVMIELNNRYALDGRDPNSYSGIFWVLGRYDRAWGPERPVFGTVRWMSSANTARKVRVREYLKRYA